MENGLVLTDRDALAALAAGADADEESRSAYWEYEVGNFSVAADGTMTGQTTLGNVSRRVSPLRNAVHRILQRPLWRFASAFPDLADSERLGRLVARRQNRQFNYDMLRQSFSLALIRHYLDLNNPDECNLVIGDGYGVMSALLLMHAPHRRTLIANLTKPLLLDLAFIRQAVPEVHFALVSNREEMTAALGDESIRLIAVRADDVSCLEEAKIGLAVNIVSMQEMDLTVIEKYFRLFRGNKADQTAFYCCNRLFKLSNFEDYPWRDTDRILHDSLCDWSQWYYTARPPFWHRRDGGKKLVWHRLALLKKENA